MSLASLKKDLRKAATDKRAKTNAWFFKTDDGCYGAGDKFIGVKVPDNRVVAKKYQDLSFSDLKKLINSPIHEERLCALFILVSRFEKGNDKDKKQAYDFYLKNLSGVNNWDLVDTSAAKIVGEYLLNKDRKILYKLAKSKDLWEKRAAIIATNAFIKKTDFKDTFKISEILLNDEHDLIHKAVGWMVREVGNRDMAAEEKFLKKHYKKMPRTMLRYAIEKFPKAKYQAYLKGKV